MGTGAPDSELKADRDPVLRVEDRPPAQLWRRQREVEAVDRESEPVVEVPDESKEAEPSARAGTVSRMSAQSAARRRRRRSPKSSAAAVRASAGRDGGRVAPPAAQPLD